MQSEFRSGEAPLGPKAVPGRRLNVRVQAVCLVAFGGALILAFSALPAMVRVASAQKTEPAASPADAAFKPTPDQWRGFKIQRVDTQTFAALAETDGKIAADDDLTTPVFSPYSGRVLKVMARAGDEVSAGSPLFAIQASELAQAENDLISGAATLRTAQAQLELAKASEQRLHLLYLGHGAALKDWQQSRVDLATAQGGLSTAEIAAAAVHARLRILGETDEQIRALQSHGNFLLQGASTIVRAPIAGTIIQRQVSPGQNIVSAAASQGAAQPVFAIGSLSRVWLVAQVPETDATAIHKGDPVRVHVLAVPGRTYDARVTYVGATIDPNTHRLPVRAEVGNSDGLLKPEMFAYFEIVTDAGAAKPAVPEDAVVFDGAAAHVWLADPAKQTLELRPVSVGRTDHGMIEVTAGLQAGDSVVTSGSVFIDRSVAGS